MHEQTQIEDTAYWLGIFFSMLMIKLVIPNCHLHLLQAQPERRSYLNPFYQYDFKYIRFVASFNHHLIIPLFCTSIIEGAILRVSADAL